jgi:KDO2-lipid IV(A) lauroyltransferase
MKILIGSFFKVFAFIVASAPVSIRLRLGDFIGFLWFDLFRIRRVVAVDNVRKAYPLLSEDECVSIARASLHSMGRTLIEYCSFPFLTEEKIDQTFTIHGREILDRALSDGRGAILLTQHLGNGDYAGAALSLKGVPVNLISKEFKSAWLNDLWFGMRKRSGTRFISPQKSSFEILRALKRNETVVFVLDQFMGPPVGVRTRFFGRVTGTAMGCAVIAERTKTPVIPCYTYRKEDGTHEIYFDEPITYLDDSPREENIAAMTQVYTDKVEEMVRRHPKQWMWIHRRWKEFRD